MGSDLSELQRRIGYEFSDPSLLRHALTHSSYSNENHTGRLGSNERLEFLGDAVLELVSSEYFFRKHEDIPEGELTRLRASYVCEQALYETAEKIPLSAYIFLGKGEEATGGRKRASVISDAFEALFGAVYLDGGFEKARELIQRVVLNYVESDIFFFDSKTVLQEELRKTGTEEPEYVLTGQTGPDHSRMYTVELRHSGTVLAKGTATSKKHAEQMAAFSALKKMGKV